MIDTVASLPFHVEVLYGCALTKHMNVASKTATDGKTMASHSGGIVNADFLCTKEY